MNKKKCMIRLKLAQHALILAVFIMVTGPVLANPLQFDAIYVEGNERLTDKDVLTLCAVSLEQTYNEADLREIVSCLGQSGHFEKVSLVIEAPNLTILVNEATQYTGVLDLSVSLGSDRGESGRFFFENHDLFNRGLQGSIELEVAREERSFIATLANSNIWLKGWRGGLTLSYRGYSYEDHSYNHRRAILAPFVTIPLSSQKTLTFKSGVQIDEMYNLSSSASPILQREFGKRTSLFVGLDYDAVFLSKALPNTRLEFQASQAVVGLGENYIFSGTHLRGRATTAVAPGRLNVSFGIEAGHLESFGSEGTKAMDRFHLGGSSLRGFAPKSIGPLDGGDRLGGTSYAVANIETRSPLFTFGRVRFEGGAFVDVGSVWGLDDTAGFVDPTNDSLKFRTTAGLSLTANIGNVPVTAYYAKPLKSKANDKTQTFGFSIQSSF